MSLPFKPAGGEKGADQNFSRALQMFQRKDPTFRVYVVAEREDDLEWDESAAFGGVC